MIAAAWLIGIALTILAIAQVANVIDHVTYHRDMIALNRSELERLRKFDAEANGEGDEDDDEDTDRLRVIREPDPPDAG